MLLKHLGVTQELEATGVRSGLPSHLLGAGLPPSLYETRDLWIEGSQGSQDMLGHNIQAQGGLKEGYLKT